MRYVRYDKNGTAVFGLLDEADIITEIEGDLFGNYSLTNIKFPLTDIGLLSPVMPSKVVCVGLNYKEHAEEMNEELIGEPVLFIKPSTAVIGPFDWIEGADFIDRIDYECELAVIIGKKCKNVTENNAFDFIFGYSCLNDVTARNIQSIDKQWTRAKSYDTFCPIGPWITDKEGIDPDSLDIATYLNGEVKQHSNTSCFIKKVAYLVSYISRVMTLLPGDVISTGTPCGIGSMKKGDTVTVSIEGIGELTNYLK